MPNLYAKCKTVVEKYVQLELATLFLAACFLPVVQLHVFDGCLYFCQGSLKEYQVSK